jgi:hypothetical protein
VLGPAHEDTLASRINVATAEIRQEKFREAEGTLRSVCDTYSSAGLQVWRRYYCQMVLGASLVGQKRLEEAEPLLLAGYRGLKEKEASIPASSKQVIARAAEWLARLYREEGKLELAAQWKNVTPAGGSGDRPQ